MSFLSSLRSKLSSVLDGLQNQVKAVAAYFLPKVGQLAEAAIDDLLSIAATAVLAEAPRLISGQDKFDSAVQTVIRTVTSQGKVVAQNTAAAAVQLAFLEIQKLAKGN